MKPISEKTLHCGPNAWGQYTNQYVQTFEIEPEDVGVTFPHYRGHHHSAHKFTPGDVGRTISVHSYAEWTCWTFGTFAEASR